VNSRQSATKQLILGKYCRTCGQTRPLDDFYRHPTSASGRQSSCKDCQKQRAAAWQRAHPDRHHVHGQAWKTSHPDRVEGYQATLLERRDRAARDRTRAIVRAAVAVRRAILAGVLLRPDQCQECRRQSVIVDGVHEDYDRPLAVVWLCRRCHYRWSLARRQARGGTR
jgi:hypothetical protein